MTGTLLALLNPEVKTMKNTLSYLTVLLGLFVLTACGDDNNRVTTQDISCTSDSYFDYDDNKWYLNRNDRRECNSNVNPHGYYGGVDCGPGEVSARIWGSQSNTHGQWNQGSNHWRNQGQQGHWNQGQNSHWRNQPRHHDPYYGNSRFRTGSRHRSNAYAGFGWNYNAQWCIGVNADCLRGTSQILNQRDYGDYGHPPVNYHSGNRTDSLYRDSGGFLRVCVAQNYAYSSGGHWYLDNDRFDDNNLTNEEQLIVFGVGVLTGIVLNNIFSN